MELSFIIKALQRRWWIIVLFSLLGAVLGSLVDTNTDASYESVGLLLVSPPSDGTITFLNNPDRYVQGQLTVLASLSLAEQVATAVGDPNADVVIKKVDFDQVTETDIIAVTSTSIDAERARLVAQTYIDLYIAGESQSAADSQQPDIQLFDDLLASLQEDLRVVNEAIQEAMRIFVLDDGPIPSVASIVPDEDAERALLIDQINRVQADRNELVLSSRLRTNSQVVQNANLPTSLTESSNSLLIIGGYIMGALLGVVVALMWAQFSPYLIDELSTAEVTGQPVVGTLTRSRTLRGNPLLAAQQARGRTVQTLGQLAVRSEALGSVSRPLVVVTIGPRQGAGATTTALAMAGRFAQQGAMVTVLDADDRDRTLSLRHGGEVEGGLNELVTCVEKEKDCKADRVLSPTELSGVNVIAQRDELSTLRRANAQAVIATAALFGDVLIVDGGPLLGSATVIEACHHADAIVMTIPLQKQLRTQLQDVIQQLGSDRSKLLTVVNEPTNQGFLRSLFSTKS
ncbi:MAG: hypothetical protein ACC660_01520 [Acidimicrobiales bacterium]